MNDKMTSVCTILECTCMYLCANKSGYLFYIKYFYGCVELSQYMYNMYKSTKRDSCIEYKNPYE